jgi:hypothetical protein
MMAMTTSSSTSVKARGRREAVVAIMMVLGVGVEGGSDTVGIENEWMNEIERVIFQ